MKTVIFRVDGNKNIGMGHVIRCMALASAFFNKGYQIIYAMSDDTLKNRILKHGFGFMCVDSKYDDYNYHATVFLKYVKVTVPSLVVVDNYSVSSNYLSRIRELTTTMFISEEYDSDKVNSVDYFLNYNVYMNSVVPIKSSSTQLLGTRYTLLREEFGRPLRVKSSENKTITIFTGGSDLYNVSEALVQHLISRDSLKEYQIRVVSGELNPNISRLLVLSDLYSRVTVVIEPLSMADIMDDTSIAVSSGGSILYELCSRGIPCVSYSIAPNQNRIVCKFNEMGLIPYAGDMLLQKAETIQNCVGLVERISSSYLQSSILSRKMVDVCNRFGAKLVVKMITTPQTK